MSTVLTMAGAFDLAQTNNVAQLRGEVCAGRTVIPVLYNNFDLLTGAVAGRDKLDAAIAAVPAREDITVFGYSFGAVAASMWLRDKADTCPVDPSRLRFVFIGNSARPGTGLAQLLGYCPATRTDSPYPVLDIARQWDRWADFPNVLASQHYSTAVSNVNDGDWPTPIHGHYEDVWMDDPTNMRSRVGNVTLVLARTAVLPLRQLWPRTTAAQVETAYARPGLG